MPLFKFSKLVRDDIVNQQIAGGASPIYRTLPIEDHKTELTRKISEEAAEVATAPAEERASELADVKQAFEDLCKLYNVSLADVSEAQELKRTKNGAFQLGHYIDTVELSEDNSWTAYYRANADRYPEITKDTRSSTQ